MNDWLDRIANVQLSWWMWPLFLVVLAVVCDSASLFFHPLGDEWVALPNGTQFGETCAMILMTGLPCPQCGMTRSWVHGIRGDLVSAFFFSPPGLALLLWANVAGIFGAIRLFRRDPYAVRLPPSFVVGWTLFWLIPLYMGTYLLRIFGINPLP